MSQTFLLNPATHDLLIKNGTLARVWGVEEVRQRILVTLLHNWEEYFLNVPAGVPWYEYILGSKDVKTAKALIQSAILGVPGVTGVVDLKLVMNNRRCAIYSDVEVSGQQGPVVVPVYAEVG